MDGATSNNHKYPDHPLIQSEPTSPTVPLASNPSNRTRPNVTQTKTPTPHPPGFHLPSPIPNPMPQVGTSGISLRISFPLPPAAPRCAPPENDALVGSSKGEIGVQTHQSRASSSSASFIQIKRTGTENTLTPREITEERLLYGRIGH